DREVRVQLADAFGGTRTLRPVPASDVDREREQHEGGPTDVGDLEDAGVDAVLQGLADYRVDAPAQRGHLGQVLGGQGVQLVLDDAGRHVVARMPGAEPGDQLTQPLDRVGGGRAPADVVERVLVTDQADPVEQLLLRAEVHVHPGGGQARGGGDVPGGGRVV